LAPGEDTPAGGRVFVVRACLIIALAALVRFLFIGRNEVWLDEAYAFAVARKGFSAILSDLALGNEPPLYSFLLHFWMKAFGDSPAALRSLSAVFSAATVAVVAFWNTPWLSRGARLLAAFTLAITPIAIYYGQTARMYSLVVFLILVSMVFLDRGLRAGGVANWALLALFTAAALYTSYVAVFFIPLGYLVLAVQYFLWHHAGLARQRAVSLLAAHVAVAIVFLPWLPVFLNQPTSKAIRWIRPFWQYSNKVSLPLESLSVMSTGGAYYPIYLRYLYGGPSRISELRQSISDGEDTRPFSKALAGVPPLVPLALMAFLAFSLLSAAFWGADRRLYKVFLAVWLLLSFGVPILLSLVTPMFIVGRYELPGVPAFALLAGVGLSRLPVRARAACITLATLLFLYTWGLMCIAPPGGYPYKGADLARTVSAGDVVLCEGFEEPLMYYHVGLKRDIVTFLTFPRDTIRHSGWIDFAQWLEPPDWGEARPALWEEAYASLNEAIEKTPVGRELVIVRQSDPPRWAASMDDVLSSAVQSALDSGRVVPDLDKSIIDAGIIVLRRPD
jgi:4-amino-4-deoxy-L-arabinose transferase-like glycosyltransferase